MTTNPTRFDYAGPFKSAERADDVLQQLINSDQLSPFEGMIECRDMRIDGKARRRYWITTPY